MAHSSPHFSRLVPMLSAASPAPGAGASFLPADALRALQNHEILHEGPLSVRQNRGWVGLRRWMTRYYVICRSDWTLRRYKSIAEAERPTRVPRCLDLRDVNFIRADGASRFLITHIDGSEVKLAGESSEDTRALAAPWRGRRAKGVLAEEGVGALCHAPGNPLPSQAHTLPPFPQHDTRAHTHTHPCTPRRGVAAGLSGGAEAAGGGGKCHGGRVHGAGAAAGAARAV
jgi:hypothetical protein